MDERRHSYPPEAHCWYCGRLGQPMNSRVERGGEFLPPEWWHCVRCEVEWRIPAIDWLRWGRRMHPRSVFSVLCSPGRPGT